eukprot:2389264-Rhodomonas_salina.1
MGCGSISLKARRPVVRTKRETTHDRHDGTFCTETSNDFQTDTYPRTRWMLVWLSLFWPRHELCQYRKPNRGGVVSGRWFGTRQRTASAQGDGRAATWLLNTMSAKSSMSSGSSTA